ncbi:hypothetical protein LTR74_017951 [Friedmanniomyces endolithicus]|nr:hypothetical protein LTR74_017951 [Friedmanniomyces endolithicus]
MSNAVMLSPADYSIWSMTVDVPTNTSISYSYVSPHKRDETDLRVASAASRIQKRQAAQGAMTGLQGRNHLLPPYHINSGIQLAFVVIILIMVPLIPESPRWHSSSAAGRRSTARSEPLEQR